MLLSKDTLRALGHEFDTALPTDYEARGYFESQHSGQPDTVLPRWRGDNKEVVRHWWRLYGKHPLTRMVGTSCVLSGASYTSRTVAVNLIKRVMTPGEAFAFEAVIGTDPHVVLPGRPGFTDHAGKDWAEYSNQSINRLSSMVEAVLDYECSRVHRAMVVRGRLRSNQRSLAKLEALPPARVLARRAQSEFASAFNSALLKGSEFLRGHATIIEGPDHGTVDLRFSRLRGRWAVDGNIEIPGAWIGWHRKGITTPKPGVLVLSADYSHQQGVYDCWRIRYLKRVAREFSTADGWAMFERSPANSRKPIIAMAASRAGLSRALKVAIGKRARAVLSGAMT